MTYIYVFITDRWFCHFDDDLYVNVPVLVAALKKYRSESLSDGVYFGRWPGEVVGKPLKDGVKVSIQQYV